MTELLEKSLVGDSDTSLPLYIDAYQQINKFIPLLNKEFSFVEKNLLEKEKILCELYIDDLAHYNTTNSRMLQLHRALLYIVNFLKNLNDSCTGDQISALCEVTYNNTLSKHHSWIVRKLVSELIHLLASRDCMLNAIINERSPHYEQIVKQTITRFIDIAEQIFDRLQQIYENKNILNLP